MLLVFSLSLLPFISSAPPVLSTVQAGSLEIIAPSYEYVQVGLDKDIYWHVFNSTKLLTNTSVTCNYHMYEQNKKGEHIVTVDNVKLFTNGRDFEVEVKGANFTLGRYCHLIECNTSNQAGGIERCFEVTKTGIVPTAEETEISKTAIYFILILSLTFICVGFMFIGKGLWTTWLGIFMMSLGSIFMYYDLVMVNMYINTIGTTGQSVEGIFLIFARFIKLLPYITALIVGFAIVKMLKGATSKKQAEDGWDNNKY